MRRATAMVVLTIMGGCSSSSPTLSGASADQSNDAVSLDRSGAGPSSRPLSNAGGDSNAPRDEGSSTASNDFPVERQGARLGDLRPSDWVADNGFRELFTPYPASLSYFLDHANLVTVVKRPIDPRSTGMAAFRDTFIGRVLETDQVTFAGGRPYKIYTYEFNCDARSMILLSTSTGVFGQSDPNGKPQSMSTVSSDQEKPVAMPSTQWNELCQTNHGVPFRPAMQ